MHDESIASADKICSPCGVSLASVNNRTMGEGVTSTTMHDPGARIRGMSLFVLIGLAIAGIVLFVFGLTQTEYQWGGAVLTETGRSCVAFGNALLGLATASLLPMLSFAAWQTSRWKCRMVRKWMEESQSSVHVSWSFEGSLGGWAQFYTGCVYLGGAGLVVVILALSFGETDADPFIVQVWGSLFSWVLFVFFWSVCLNEQLNEAKEVCLLLKTRNRGDMVLWTQAQIKSMVDDMIAIPEKAFSIGKYAVTQIQWEAIMGDAPFEFKGDHLPVESVSWEDCQSFLQKLNATEEAQASGMVFRLPTAEEWEFACRAGATGPYCKLANGTEITKNTLDEVAWYDANSGKRTHPVGQKKPNAFGLYDMHGNVWEWTSTEDGLHRVYCGGGWNYSAKFCVSSYRNWDSPDYRDNYLGFRLCADRRMSINQG